MAVLKYLDKKFELILLGIMLAIFTLLMFINVVLRYVWGSAIVWGDEMCRYCLVVSTFMSIPIWVRRRSGIRVDALVTLLPKQIEKFLEIVVYILMLIFFLFLFYSGLGVYGKMAVSGQVSAAMHMPIKYLYAIVEFCLFLSALRTIQVLIELVRDFNEL